jgi:hypothetical protein
LAADGNDGDMGDDDFLVGLDKRKSLPRQGVGKVLAIAARFGGGGGGPPQTQQKPVGKSPFSSAPPPPPPLQPVGAGGRAVVALFDDDDDDDVFAPGPGGAKGGTFEMNSPMAARRGPGISPAASVFSGAEAGGRRVGAGSSPAAPSSAAPKTSPFSSAPPPAPIFQPPGRGGPSFFPSSSADANDGADFQGANPMSRGGRARPAAPPSGVKTVSVVGSPTGGGGGKA